MPNTVVKFQLFPDETGSAYNMALHYGAGYDPHGDAVLRLLCESIGAPKQTAASVPNLKDRILTAIAKGEDLPASLTVAYADGASLPALFEGRRPFLLYQGLSREEAQQAFDALITGKGFAEQVAVNAAAVEALPFIEGLKGFSVGK